MQNPVQITIRDVPQSEALKAHIADKAAKLEEFFPRITSCRIVVERPGQHKRQGKLYSVRIDVRVPGAELVVDRGHLSEDVYVAVRDAFEAARRKLEDYARRVRGEVKAHAAVSHGRVVRMFREEGYGFIAGSDGRELYFSSDNVVDPGFERLDIGAEVQFVEELAGEGPQAKRVSVGKHHVAP